MFVPEIYVLGLSFLLVHFKPKFSLKSNFLWFKERSLSIIILIPGEDFGKKSKRTILVVRTRKNLLL